jgi:hypothetical protein
MTAGGPPAGQHRLRRRVGEVLVGHHRPHGHVGAAALAARAAAGGDAAGWAARLGIDRERLAALEGGWLHPALAPARLLELAPATAWMALARAAPPPDRTIPRGTVGDRADPVGACRSRHPTARRGRAAGRPRPVDDPPGDVHGPDTPTKPGPGTVPVSPGRGTVIPRRTPGRHG